MNRKSFLVIIGLNLLVSMSTMADNKRACQTQFQSQYAGLRLSFSELQGAMRTLERDDQITVVMHANLNGLNAQWKAMILENFRTAPISHSVDFRISSEVDGVVTSTMSGGAYEMSGTLGNIEQALQIAERRSANALPREFEIK